jgi:arabinogalactan endo-1,4-beta-galactosidase
MKSMVSAIQKRHGKEVFIAETSYPYTLEDGDGFPNSVSSPKDLMEGYPATVEGQKNMIADVIQNANDAGAFGVFYWEGTWIPVGSDRKSNEEIWEKYGSGWASSYSKDYDPEDAGLYYGGCSWDNQALFDFKGNPLDSLKVFGELKK